MSGNDSGSEDGIDRRSLLRQLGAGAAASGILFGSAAGAASADRDSGATAGDELSAAEVRRRVEMDVEEQRELSTQDHCWDEYRCGPTTCGWDYRAQRRTCCKTDSGDTICGDWEDTSICC